MSEARDVQSLSQSLSPCVSSFVWAIEVACPHAGDSAIFKMNVTQMLVYTCTLWSYVWSQLANHNSYKEIFATKSVKEMVLYIFCPQTIF